MRYDTVALPFRTRQLSACQWVAVSDTGDHAFLSSEELRLLQTSPIRLPLERLAELRARFLVESDAPAPGLRRLARSRIASRRETVRAGPSAVSSEIK